MKIDSTTRAGDGDSSASGATGWRSRFRAPARPLGLFAFGLAAAGSVAIAVSSASANNGNGHGPGHACDNSILEGDYGFSFSGSTNGLPFVGVGSETCDEDAACTGVTTINID